jgi:hypothetical protein
MKLPCAPILFLMLGLFACRAGPIPGDTEADDDDDPPEVLGDPWKCGELGLKCVGPLGIGQCINEQCTPKLGNQCWGADFAPTCDHYCEAFEQSCAFEGCEGATFGDGWATSRGLDTCVSTATGSPRLRSRWHAMKRSRACSTSSIAAASEPDRPKFPGPRSGEFPQINSACIAS